MACKVSQKSTVIYMFWFCCHWASGNKKSRDFMLNILLPSSKCMMENTPIHKTHQHNRNQPELPQQMTLHITRRSKNLCLFFLWPHRDGNLGENFFQTLYGWCHSSYEEGRFCEENKLARLEVTSWQMCREGSCLQFMKHRHTYIKEEVNSINTF